MWVERLNKAIQPLYEVNHRQNRTYLRANLPRYFKERFGDKVKATVIDKNFNKVKTMIKKVYHATTNDYVLFSVEKQEWFWVMLEIPTLMDLKQLNLEEHKKQEKQRDDKFKLEQEKGNWFEVKVQDSGVE